VDYWEKLVGPAVKGAKSVDDFLNRLGKFGYNSEDPKWRELVKDAIDSQFLPKHIQERPKETGT
jgi:hypothetical protein